jgi:hypothetical protein
MTDGKMTEMVDRKVRITWDYANPEDHPYPFHSDPHVFDLVFNQAYEFPAELYESVAASLQPGSIIRIGGVDCKVVEAKALYRLVQQSDWL